MRRLVIVMAAAACTAIAPVPATAASPETVAPAAWEPDSGAARAYAARRTGTVAFSVRTGDRSWEHRAHERLDTASVIKAMLLVAYLDRPGVRRRALKASDRALLEPMIRYSDNDTASRVRDLVGDERIERLARRTRIRDFRLAAAWGLSQTSATDQARWFLQLPQRVPGRHRAYAMDLLRTIIPEQRWGIAQVRPRGWTLHFKGGWGAGAGAVSHQVALLRRGRERVALAIMTDGSPTPEYGRETLRGVALRLLRGLADAPRQDAHSLKRVEPKRSPIAPDGRGRWPAFGLQNLDLRSIVERRLDAETRDA